MSNMCYVDAKKAVTCLCGETKFHERGLVLVTAHWSLTRDRAFSIFFWKAQRQYSQKVFIHAKFIYNA